MDGIKRDLEEIRVSLMGVEQADQMQRERRWQEKQKTLRCLVKAFALIMSVLLICVTVLLIDVIRTQQYALNMQYAGLLDYINSAEVTHSDEVIETGNNGVIIQGDQNEASVSGDCISWQK